MSLKVVRDEEDDSGFSRQVTVTWTIPRFRTVYGRARPKQRIKSQPFRVPNVSGFDVNGVVVFFPKGLARLDEAPDVPVVGVGVRHAPRDPDPSTDARRKVQKKRLATPVAVEVEAFTDNSGDGDEPDMLGVSLGTSVEVEVMKRTAVPQWATAADRGDRGDDDDDQIATADDVIEVPDALNVEQLHRVATALTFVVKITLLSHGDDLSDVSDDFGIEAEARQRAQNQEGALSGDDDNLFSQVLTRGQGMFQHLLNDVGATPTRGAASSSDPTAVRERRGDATAATPEALSKAAAGDGEATPAATNDEDGRPTAVNSAAAAANALVSGAAELFHRHPSDVDYSAEWQPLIDVYCNEDAAPNAWRHFNVGCWSVMVHCLSDMEDLLLSPSAAWVEATAAWSRPSPNAVGALTSWCPPLRQKLLELVPYRTTYKEFWVGFFCLLDTCSRLNPLREARELEAALLHPGASSTGHQNTTTARAASVRSALQLLSFVLMSLAPDTLQVSSIPRADVEAQLEYVRDAMQRMPSSGSNFSAPAAGGKKDVDRLHCGEPAAAGVLATLEGMLSSWKQEEAFAVRAHFQMVEHARNICEHGSWSLLARRTLAASAERSAHSVSEVVDAIAIAVDACKALVNLKPLPQVQ